MRLIFFGDMGPTGFGTVTRDMGRELLALGVDIRFVSQNEVEDDLPEPFGSRTWKVTDPNLLHPDLSDVTALGQSSLALMSTGYAGFFDGRLWEDGWTPDTCLVLGDPGNIRLMVMRDEHTRAAFSSVPAFHYVPIEGVDLPPTLREMWAFLRPIAMSNFGADQIEALGLPRPPMVYHGVDSDTFHPVSPERMLVLNGKKLRSKADCKRFIANTDEGRWLVRTDSNWPRKRYPELFRSLAPVLAERPDVHLIVHCRMRWKGGDLEDWLSKYPARIRSQIVVTDAGGQVDRSFLVALYNAADVYVSNSAEGFGLTIAESLACGTPAVGIDYASVPEVIGPGGIATPIAGLVDNEFGYFWASANSKAFGQAVGELLDDPARRKALGRAGRDHATRSFRWDTAASQMVGIFGAASVEAAA